MLLKARLVREKMTAFYETIERPLVPVVAAMECRGIKVDRVALAELSRDFARRIAETEQAIFRAVGNEFNIGSTKQLGDVLFDKLGLPGGKKGKTGAYGTDASILEELAPLHEVPGHVLEWRQLTKLKSTYADALGRRDRRRDRAGAHLLRARGGGDRTVLVEQSQPAEHSDPHRGGPPHPPRLCRRARPSAVVGGLQPDRIAPRRPCRRCARSSSRPSATVSTFTR